MIVSDTIIKTKTQCKNPSKFLSSCRGISQDAYADESLGIFLGKLVKEYGHLEFNRFSTNGASDHASWTRNGYRAQYPPSRPRPGTQSPYWHTVDDTIDKLDLKRAMKFVAFAVGYVVELSTKL